MWVYLPLFLSFLFPIYLSITDIDVIPKVAVLTRLLCYGYSCESESKNLKTRIIYLFWAHIGSSVQQHTFSSARFLVRLSSIISSNYILKLSLNILTSRRFIHLVLIKNGLKNVPISTDQNISSIYIAFTSTLCFKKII